MSLAIVRSCAVQGLEALPVVVEVHVGSGLPAFHVVGLPDAGVRESRERVRSALINSGYEFPAGRITVNLAPADLPKESGRFDLPIAVGMLLASGQIACDEEAGAGVPDMRDYLLVGELSLTGTMGALDAVLAIALGASRLASPVRLLVPHSAAALAACVPRLCVLGAQTLSQVVDHLRGQRILLPVMGGGLRYRTTTVPCLSDVQGQAAARRALEIVAAGRHSMLMAGPPGVGKSMLAQRLPGILPPLDSMQALEAAAISGVRGVSCEVEGHPPFRAPHHSVSMAALVGGGMRPRPGEISLAHHGVLFLDELPEFERRVLEALREPLETGVISIARASGSHTFPANFQLIAAMNPCPCGWLGHATRPCRCTPERIERYRARLSGPLLDRIDVHLGLGATTHDACVHSPGGEPSGAVRARVLRCRAIQTQRQGVLNAALGAEGLARHCRLEDDAQIMLARAGKRWSWSVRAMHRVLRVARTIADLDQAGDIALAHIAEAIQYRLNEPG